MALKRFYREVSTATAEGGHTVCLDGRFVRTPDKAPLGLPTQDLAEAVAAEWQAQEGEIRPQTMPMTQLANTAIDRVRPRRTAVIDSITAYAQTDLLCYRAAGPASLVRRQASHWQPLLDWAALRLDARLSVTAGVIPVEQPPDAVTAVRCAVEESDVFGLSGLYTLTTASGSVVLALAVREEEIDATTAFDASQLDEVWQEAQWGQDELAVARRKRIRTEIGAAARFLSLLKA